MRAICGKSFLRKAKTEQFSPTFIFVVSELNPTMFSIGMFLFWSIYFKQSYNPDAVPDDTSTISSSKTALGILQCSGPSFHPLLMKRSFLLFVIFY